MDRDKLTKSGYEHKRIHSVCLPKFGFTSINPMTPWGARSPKGASLFQPIFLLHYLYLFLSHGEIRDFTNFSQLTTMHRISCPLPLLGSSKLNASNLFFTTVMVHRHPNHHLPSLLVLRSSCLTIFIILKYSEIKGDIKPTISIYLKNMKSISIFVDFPSKLYRWDYFICITPRLIYPL